jgi:putative transposase
MRMNRVKSIHTAVYHLVSRVRQEQLFEEEEAKNGLRELLLAAVEFSGVELLTYVALDNHFHLLVRVPAKAVADALVTDDEMIRRVRALKGEAAADKLSKWRPELCRAYALMMHGLPLTPEYDARVVARWNREKQRYLIRMHDVSQFMKVFKEGLSAWYSKKYRLHGTIWTDRYASRLMPDNEVILQAVATFIDLHPVRLGLVEHPADYRWCGYAEAVAAAADADQEDDSR